METFKNLIPLPFTVIMFLAVLTVFGACSEPSVYNETIESGAEVICDSDNGGLSLPEGFCAVVVVDSLGPTRHITVAPNGDLYVKTRTTEGGIVALRDTSGDYRADLIEHFSSMTPMARGILWETEVRIHEGYLWASNTEAVYRWPLPENGVLVPEGEPEIMITGFPEQGSHASKSFTFDGKGYVYVNVGAPSNACQEQQRQPGSPGIDPCPQLERQAGIWRFRDDVAGQTQQEDGFHYGIGIRNVVGLDWNPEVDELFVTQHGRDQLSTLWPDLFNNEQSAELPAEELLMITEGANAGWPYCYYDWQKEQKVLAPEYGGDGTKIGRCSEFVDPVVAFPGHWAPNDLLFYRGEHFPKRYTGGAFIAFHGSWNRAPLPQQGYKVVFVPFENGVPSDEYETFADGFKGGEDIAGPSQAKHRPMGLAMAPDGALYISDSVQGRIWRVTYRGQ